jgi:hypothetical protein
MPLPLPNLDTRRWSDLVEEGRALIPRYAPDWTDHNVHDPGITLVELFAWLTEGAVFRANRVTDRSRRKFLSLIGYDALPPRPASLVVAFRHGGGTPRMLPAGLVLETPVTGEAPLRASLDADLTVVAAQALSLVQLEGDTIVDRSRALAAPRGLPLFGADPTPGAAFAIGFDRPLPPAEWISLAIELAGPHTTRTQRLRAQREDAAQAEACAPALREPCGRPRRGCPCPEDEGYLDEGPAAACEHGPGGGRGAPAVVWEFSSSAGWTAIADTDLDDGTESLLWSGILRLRIAGAMTSLPLGGTPPRYWLRCRYAAGAYDATPALAALALNAATVTQAERPLIQIPVVPGGAVTGGPLQPGTEAAFDLRFDAGGKIDALGLAPAAASVPHAFIAEYTPPGAADGRLVMTLVRLDPGSGLPIQRVSLPDAPVVGVSLWSLEASGWRAWTQRVDLDASAPADAHFVLDATLGEVAFGDGERGRVVPLDASLVAAYRTTRGARGNAAPGAAWTIADTPISRAVLGSAFPAAVTDVASVSGVATAVAGADEESFAEAAGRAAAALWAHEQLVELADAAEAETLDGLDPNAVLAATPPARAATVLDFDRLALDVPGTLVRRARAWPSLDPSFPGVRALGTVTVMVLPELPARRPMPSGRLLGRVRRYLDRRRILGTRLVVNGPVYVEIRVTAAVTLLPGAEPSRGVADVRAALDHFLDPLRGGPDGRGWPFGRDVYRSEILQVIDDVEGVDHVASMTMSADGKLVDCGNACLAPGALAVSGAHAITVTA